MEKQLSNTNLKQLGALAGRSLVFAGLRTLAFGAVMLLLGATLGYWSAALLALVVAGSVQGFLLYRVNFFGLPLGLPKPQIAWALLAVGIVLSVATGSLLPLGAHLPTLTAGVKSSTRVTLEA
ncbi:hypothetical protein BSR29_01205 [Boudabousia liubingyangii]|uniref:Uncharacterized protein n=1 Tax=Boudabousia liubingyangii TaxID=1921764 RepID=A0A1Q5PQB7_9ACTO|nr:hypothetical protein [Boudabousia liubingyangii]OKL48363.1 hypothetical protein BSR28_01280 [Boudabousia liubingyangii]OKL49605.1 hypothetical protein BSR29_01205 [Boudabousia liubingyangii]